MSSPCNAHALPIIPFVLRHHESAARTARSSSEMITRCTTSIFLDSPFPRCAKRALAAHRVFFLWLPIFPARAQWFRRYRTFFLGGRRSRSQSIASPATLQQSCWSDGLPHRSLGLIRADAQSLETRRLLSVQLNVKAILKGWRQPRTSRQTPRWHAAPNRRLVDIARPC